MSNGSRPDIVPYAPSREGASAVGDVFWLQSLIGQLRDCIAEGRLFPASRAAEEEVDCIPGHLLLYVDDPQDPKYMDIVYDYEMSGGACEVRCTFSDMLHNLDVRLCICDDMPDGRRHVKLGVFPKGEGDGHGWERLIFCIEPSDPVYGIGI